MSSWYAFNFGEKQEKTTFKSFKSLMNANISLPNYIKADVQGSSITNLIYDCPICKARGTLRLDKKRFMEITKYPFSILTLHVPKNNPHMLLLYLDANLKIRGIESIDYTTIPFQEEEICNAEPICESKLEEIQIKNKK